MHAVALICSPRYLSAGSSFEMLLFLRFHKTSRTIRAFPIEPKAVLFHEIESTASRSRFIKESRCESIRFKIYVLRYTGPYHVLGESINRWRLQHKRRNPPSLRTQRMASQWNQSWWVVVLYAFIFVLRLMLEHRTNGRTVIAETSRSLEFDHFKASVTLLIH